MSWWDDDYDDYGGGGGQRRDTEVSFYRPDGSCEGKDIGWCLDNGFHEIEDGLWSGDWYYRHHPNYKEEKEAARKEQEAKRKSISPQERLERAKKERRGELLDEIYNGAFDPNHPMYDGARRELDILDGRVIERPPPKGSCKEGEFSCPTCHIRFLTDENRDEHIKTRTGKAHNRYREKHHIDFKGWTPPTAPQTHNSSPEQQKPETPLPPNQTDIRSFFKTNTSASDTQNSQSDIRSFFQQKKK